MPAPDGDSAGTQTPHTSGRRWFWLLYVLLVASCMFAAWQIYVFATSETRPAAPPSPSAAGPRGNAVNTAQTTPFDPSDVRGDPLESVGLTPLESDPGGIAPPDGARRLGASKCPADGQVWLQGRYDYRGSLAKAVEHYRGIAAARGLDRLSDRRAQFGWRQMIFGGEKLILRVSLRKNPQDGTIVRIVVVVIERS